MKSINQLFKMNGTVIEATPKSIMSNALSLMSHDLKYRSKENLIEIMIGVRDLVIDWLKSIKRSTQKYEKEQAYIRRQTMKMTRSQVVQMAYNEVLQFENLGLLRGFGLSNKFKDNLWGNPEITTINKN